MTILGKMAIVQKAQLATGIVTSLMGGFALWYADRQVNISQAAGKQTLLRQAEKSFNTGNNGTRTYVDTYERMLGNWDKRPKELAERNHLMDMVGWFGDFSFSVQKDKGFFTPKGMITPKEFQHKWGSKLDMILSNPYVQDQLLKNPRWANLVSLGQKVHFAVDDVEDSPERKRAREFLQNFDSAKSECMLLRKKKRDAGELVKMDECECPYVRKWLLCKETAP